MYQPGVIVEFFRDLSLIQSACFMAMLFAICLLVDFFLQGPTGMACGGTDDTGRNTHFAAAL